MLNFSYKAGGSECEEMISSGSTDPQQVVVVMKTCVDCGTTRTPLWRSGPAGPKSLCNACGIRSRKRRRALLGLNQTSTELKKPKKIKIKNNINNSSSSSSSSSSSTISNNNNFSKNSSKKLGESITRKLFTWQKTKLRRRLREEEQAAMLLMALSCGSVYVY